MFFARKKNTQDAFAPKPQEEPEEDSQDSEDDDYYINTRKLEPLQTKPATSRLIRDSDGPFSGDIDGISQEPDTIRKLYPIQTKPTLTDLEEQQILDWEREQRERTEARNRDPEYQFAVLVAGHLGYASVDPLIEVGAVWPRTMEKLPAHATPGKDKYAVAAEVAKSSLANGFMNYTPTFVAAIRGSHADLKSWFRTASGLKDEINAYRGAKMYDPYTKRGGVPSKEDIIVTPDDLRDQFARLVANNITLVRNRNTQQYQLKIAYDRLMMEKNMLLKEICRLIRSNGSSKNKNYK